MSNQDHEAHTDKLKKIDAEIRVLLQDRALTALEGANLTDAQRQQLAHLFSKRAMAKVQLGSAKDGLKDVAIAVLIATKSGSIDPGNFTLLLSKLLDALEKQQSGKLRLSSALLAKVGEGLRRYAGEFAINDDAEARSIDNYLKKSILCFDQALEDPGLGKEVKRWCLAHRGAARTTWMWIAKRQANLPEEPTLDQAERDFRNALALSAKPYPWCSRYLAIFLTLRRRNQNDIREAGEHLEAAAAADPRSPIERGLAMLESYIVADAKEANAMRIATANSSLSHAFNAIQLDAEDFVARYFAAVTRWWLADNAEPNDRMHHRDHKEAAIESAKLGAKSALSQAMFALAGLRAMEEMSAAEVSDSNKRGRAIEIAKSTLQLLTAAKVKPDLESVVTFCNDPIFKVLLASDGGGTLPPILESQLLR